MRRHLLLATVLGLSLLTAACTGRRGGGGGGDDDDAPSGPLVKGLSIEGLALYQGVRIDILDGGDVVLDSAPVEVIAERDAMLRVLVEADGEWAARTVGAVVELDVDGETRRFSAEGSIAGSSSDNSLGSSLNVDIPGDALTTGSALVSVRLIEVETEVDAAGDDDGAEWEASGDGLALNARDTGASVRIVIIPIEYRGDGSGRLPDLSDAQIELYRDTMYALYPTKEVELVIGDTMVVNRQISGWGGGWEETLWDLMDRRNATGSFEDYYYGLFSPAQSFPAYCNGSCIAGFSSVAFTATQEQARVSMGLGFAGVGSAETMAHEIGHAHGREHAPCNVGNAGFYPHSDGLIGVQGYDLIGGDLKAPNTYTDFMGYCDNIWVSDYTYNWLTDWISEVNANAMYVPPPGFSPAWSTLRVRMDGTVSRGSDVELFMPAEGHIERLALLDASGEALDEVEGRLIPFSHLPGGTIYLPTPTDDKVTAVRLASGQVVPW